MSDQATRLFNQHLVANSVCSQCYGPLVERRVEEADLVLCPKGCQPGGFVTREFADAQRAKGMADLDEVARNYPWLDPRPKLTNAETMAGLTALFGKRD